MFYTAAWCIDNENKFREAVPLELLGQSLQRYPSAITFNIVILEGMELLSKEYILSLQQYGFDIIDYCDEFREIMARYKNISQAYSQYERNCFLRWIAFKQIATSHPGNYSQRWHLDSDVVLHTSLDDLANDTAGKTFMLQGCPVLVSIANSQWFEQYEQQLKNFDSNIIAFSNHAFAEKAACRQNDVPLVNQSHYRNPLGSDQDLLEYLVSSKKILQDNLATVFHSKYYFIQNPLAITAWHTLQSKETTQFSMGENLTIHIGNKTVPFIHYQNTFTLLAGVYQTGNHLHLPHTLLKALLRYAIEEDQFKTTIFFKAIAKMNRSRSSKSRKAIISKLMQRNGAGIVSLLNFLMDSPEAANSHLSSIP